MSTQLLQLIFPVGLSPRRASIQETRGPSRELLRNGGGGRGGKGKNNGGSDGWRWDGGGEGRQGGPKVPLILCCMAGACFLRPPFALARTHSLEKSKASPHGHTAPEPASAPSALSGMNPIVVNLGVSGLAGFVSAKFLKSIGRMIMMGMGLMLLLVQVMAHYGLVSVNWAKVNDQFTQYMHGQGGVRHFNTLFEKITAFLSTGLPSVAGFYAGFMAGIK